MLKPISRTFFVFVAVLVVQSVCYGHTYNPCNPIKLNKFMVNQFEKSLADIFVEITPTTFAGCFDECTPVHERCKEACQNLDFEWVKLSVDPQCQDKGKPLGCWCTSVIT